MDAKKLVEQLTREAKAHPAKAGMLALMCGVLIYVVAPLLASSAPTTKKPLAQSKSEKATSNADTAQAPSETKRATTTAAGTAEKTENNWREIADKIDADENMKPAEALTSDRDPFVPPPEPKVVETESEEPKKEKPKPRKLHFTPAESGLVLNSTLLGKRSRLAMVNGKPYYVYNPKKTDNRRSVVPFTTRQNGGDSDTAFDVSTGSAFFVLIDVRPRSVVLWRFGRRYELKLPGVELASRAQSGVRPWPPNPVIPVTELSP